MNALTRTPPSTDLLQPTKFLLTFGKIDVVQYYCQSVNLPGLSIGAASFNTLPSNLKAPGNKIDYNNLRISFLVDEKMLAWRQLHTWMRSIGSPEGFEERKRLTEVSNRVSSKPSYYSDATLTILSGLNNPIIRVQFHNTFPMSLSDLQFDTKHSADDIMTAEAVFNYDYFDFI